ncbi:MAG: DUF1552 domain-containing protein [Archangium sp.]
MSRLSRRFFLRGLGGFTLGLPFLETLAGRKAHAQTMNPRRFVVFFECNGVNMEKFFPATGYGALTGASFTGTSLAPLAGLENKLLIPRGIMKVPKGFNFDGQTPVGCDHQNGMGGKLTAQQLSGSDHYAAGMSVDQFIASKLNPSGRRALTLKVGPQGSGVLSVISYTGDQQPVQGQNNPWVAFQDFMSAGMPNGNAAQKAYDRRISVLDLVKTDMDALKGKRLSQKDKDKLDLHYTSIREVEMAMQQTGLPACSLPDATKTELMGLNAGSVGSDANYKQVGRLQMDVMAIALACDHTRAATLQWNNGSGGPTFKWDGMNHPYHHHAISHNATTDAGSNTGIGGSDYKQLLFEIDTWYVQQYRYLLDKLNAYQEADGKTVLDNSAVVFANELSDGLEHNFMDMPFLIAGSAGGYLKQGQYIKVTRQQQTKQSTDAPHNKLLTTLINGVGVRNMDGSPISNFGAFGEAGEFTELKA